MGEEFDWGFVISSGIGVGIIVFDGGWSHGGAVGFLSME
jgi:hypothetical protein